jgi:hypothetical protein
VSRPLLVPMPQLRSAPGDGGESSVRTQERQLVTIRWSSPSSDGATFLDIPAERMVSVNEDAEQGQQWLRQVVDEAEHVGLQQLSLIYGGLIVIVCAWWRRS